MHGYSYGITKMSKGFNFTEHMYIHFDLKIKNMGYVSALQDSADSWLFSP